MTALVDFWRAWSFLLVPVAAIVFVLYWPALKAKILAGHPGLAREAALVDLFRDHLLEIATPEQRIALVEKAVLANLHDHEDVQALVPTEPPKKAG